MFKMQGPFRKALAFLRRKKSLQASIGSNGFKTLLACAIVLSAIRLVFESPQKDGILIYVPVNQAIVKNLGDFATCMTRVKPILRGQRFYRRVDLLILTNGDRDMDRQGADAVQNAIRVLRKGVPQISKVRLLVILMPA